MATSHAHQPFTPAAIPAPAAVSGRCPFEALARRRPGIGADHVIRISRVPL